MGINNSTTTQQNQPRPRVEYVPRESPQKKSEYIAPFEDKTEMEEMKDKPKVSSLKLQLLINGYIREVQQILIKDNIIPSDIYQICLEFYNSNTFNLLWKSNCRSRPLQDSDHQQFRQFGVLDIENKQSLNINLTKFREYKDKERFYPLCFIPNVSNKYLTNNERLNCIFTVQKGVTDDYYERRAPNPTYESYPCFIFYETLSNTDDILAKYEYKSDTAISHEPSQSLYCNHKDKQMIIYEWNGKFYAMNLNDICEVNGLSLADFDEISQNEQKFELNISSRSYYLLS